MNTDQDLIDSFLIIDEFFEIVQKKNKTEINNTKNFDSETNLKNELDVINIGKSIPVIENEIQKNYGLENESKHLNKLAELKKKIVKQSFIIKKLRLKKKKLKKENKNLESVKIY
jgi:hypothetical protein